MQIRKAVSVKSGKITKSLSVILTCLFLSACLSSLLIGNAVQSKLMWSLLKPLVGFDPNEVNLFEVPMIKDRMTAILGDKYEPTMKLLRTAQEIQQEGALFYVASLMVPTEVKAIQDKAGLVWNSDTNQMAVVLIKDGATQIFSEQAEDASVQITPTLPKELQAAVSEADKYRQLLKESTEGADELKPVTGT